MFRRYEMQPLSGAGDPLVFEWDFRTGSLRGTGEPVVRELAQRALLEGEVIGRPYPTAYPIRDPLRKPAELAVILGNEWQLPESLERAYPKCASRDSSLDPPVTGSSASP